MENKINLIKNNNLMMSSFACKSIYTRLQRELTSMSKFYDEIIIEEGKTSGEINVIIYELIDNKIVCYKFVINQNYPFVCPVVFLNNRPYKSFLFGKTNYEFINLKKNCGIECFCCESLTCSVNWSPKETLNNIINEIKHYKKIKKNLVFKIIIDIIKRKYLIEDIDLTSWLF
jgi:hypothetical protein